MPSADVPYVLYNGTKYSVHHLNGDIYETEDIMLDANVTDFSLQLGGIVRPMRIKVTTGIHEEDPFNFI